MNWKDLFDRVGLNGTWWQWRILKWQERWQERAQAVRDAGKVATYEHKFCRACGAIVPREDATCSRCGTRAPSWTGDAIRRSLGLVLPRWVPTANVLIALNLLNMLAAMWFFGPQHLLKPDSVGLYHMGALAPLAFFQGEYWRLITYGFLHIGLMHIAFNMIALSQVGPTLEQQVGPSRFFSVYMLSLLGGGLADLLVRGPVMMLIAGASGALFGLIGFGMSYAHFYGGPLGREQRNFFIQWAVYGFVFGMLIGADNICHLGGFLTGALCGFLVERERLHAERFDPFWRGLATVLALMTVAAFAWLTYDAWPRG